MRCAVTLLYLPSTKIWDSFFRFRNDILKFSFRSNTDSETNHSMSYVRLIHRKFILSIYLLRYSLFHVSIAVSYLQKLLILFKIRSSLLLPLTFVIGLKGNVNLWFSHETWIFVHLYMSYSFKPIKSSAWSTKRILLSGYAKVFRTSDSLALY